MHSTKTKHRAAGPAICPVSGLPIVRRPEWTDVDLGNGYRATFEFIGDRILLSRSAGEAHANRESISRLFKLRREVLARMLAPGDSFVELRDYNHFAGISSKASRNQFITEMEKDKNRVLAFIGFNAPPAVKIGFGVWQRLFRAPFPILIEKDYFTALNKALENIRPPGKAATRPKRKVVNFPQNTYASGSFQVLYEVIDSRIVHTQASGTMAVTDVAPCVEQLGRVCKHTQSQKGPCYYINGTRDIDASTYQARQAYVEQIKQWHSDFPHFEWVIFYGANRWIKAAIHLLKHLMPIRIKLVDDFESAMDYINFRDASGNRGPWGKIRPESLPAPGQAAPTPEPVDEILEFLGSISWGSGKPGAPPPPPNAAANFVPVYDAIALIKMDLDELEIARKRSEDARQIMAAAIEQSTDSISIADTAGKLRYTNSAFTRVTGYSPEEAAGQHLSFMANSNEAAQELQNLWKGVTLGRAASEQITCRQKDGTPYIADTTVSHIAGNNDKTGDYVIVQRDVTHEVRLEAQLKQIHKMEAIGTLAGGIAHDFNNILFPIIGYTEMSLDEAAPDSQLAQNLKEVLQAATRAKQLVKQILTFSKPDRTSRKQIELAPVIKEAVSLLRASIPATIEIEQVYQKEVGLVLADPTQIHQVIVNLGSNAFHAMRNTGGVITISLEKFRTPETNLDDAPVLPPGNYQKISVADTGHGIAPEISTRIFDPFFTTKEMATNTGMGLSMSHGIVTAHNGRIVVTSTPGHGTTFEVYLPEISIPAAGQSRPPKKSTDKPPKGHGRILIVDDEAQSARIIQKIVENLGYSTATFTDAREALASFQRHPPSFDLVITDQVMPKMTGEILAAKIIKIKPEIPVIVCTGHREMLDNSVATLIREILIKPVLRNDLARAVRRALADTPDTACKEL